MASIISVLGSPLMGSPIMAKVQPAEYNAVWSFHHIVLRVYAALIYPEGSSEGISDAEFTEYDFSTPVETKMNDGSIYTLPHEFDISSALVAVADKYEYNVTPPNQYPYVKFYIEAWDDYIYAGSSGQTETKRWPERVTIHPTGSAAPEVMNTFCYAVQGAFTDFERMRCAEGYRNTYWITRKPRTSPEIVYTEGQIVRPKIFSRALIEDYGIDTNGDGINDELVEAIPDGPVSVVYSTGTEEGLLTIGEDREAFTVYVAPRTEDVYEMRFVNGFGVMESIHLKVLPSVTVDTPSENHVINKSGKSFNKFSHMTTVKDDFFETWKMTSGPVDKAWKAWYVHEFLKTEQAWIKMDETWIPCNVSAEKVTMIDKGKPGTLELEFNVRLDISGSAMVELFR